MNKYILLTLLFYSSLSRAQVTTYRKSDTIGVKARDTINYYDMLVGGQWEQPHDMVNMFRFNKDGTFATDFTTSPDGISTATTFGTYTFAGKEGWLIFKNGQRRKFLFEPPPYDHVLKIYVKGSSGDFIEFI